MRWARYQVGGTLEAYLPQRADATPTFVCYGPDGGSLQASANATLDTVNTTLSAAPSAGAGTVSVTLATGITMGRRYLIGTSEAAGGEIITVKSLASTTVTLARPLRRAHANGAAFAGTRVTLAVGAAACPTCQRHCRAELAWKVSTAAQDPLVLPFDVVRYAPVSYLCAEDLRDLDPVLAKRMAEGVWLPATIDRAWDMLLTRVAARSVHPGGLVGVIDLTAPHGYLTRALLAETSTQGAEREDLEKRFAQELDAVLAAGVYDADQDGSTTGDEDIAARWRRGGRMVRC